MSGRQDACDIVYCGVKQCRVHVTYITLSESFVKIQYWLRCGDP